MAPVVEPGQTSMKPLKWSDSRKGMALMSAALVHPNTTIATASRFSTIIWAGLRTRKTGPIDREIAVVVAKADVAESR